MFACNAWTTREVSRGSLKRRHHIASGATCCAMFSSVAGGVDDAHPEINGVAICNKEGTSRAPTLEFLGEYRLKVDPNFRRNCAKVAWSDIDSDPMALCIFLGKNTDSIFTEWGSLRVWGAAQLHCRILGISTFDKYHALAEAHRNNRTL